MSSGLEPQPYQMRTVAQLRYFWFRHRKRIFRLTAQISLVIFFLIGVPAVLGQIPLAWVLVIVAVGFFFWAVTLVADWRLIGYEGSNVLGMPHRTEDLLKELPREQKKQLENLFPIDGKHVVTQHETWRVNLKETWRAEIPNDPIPARRNDRIVYEILLTKQEGAAFTLFVWTFISIVQSGNCEEYFLARIRDWLADPEKESGEGVVLGSPPPN